MEKKLEREKGREVLERVRRNWEKLEKEEKKDLEGEKS